MATVKLALLSGADKNAGDFLIVHRSKQLLRAAIPSCEIVEFKRNSKLDGVLEELNSCDCVVFAGGPGYVPNMYPDKFPLVDNLSAIDPPFFALGMGAYTPTPETQGILFSDSSRLLLDRMNSGGFGLGCRDFVTQDVLEQNGYSPVFTGCPAWYDLTKVEEGRLIETPSFNQVNSIAISDPASPQNFEALKCLVIGLKDLFPQAELTLVFHRGWRADDFTSNSTARLWSSLVDWAHKHEVGTVDISYSHKGFSIYNECNLHVGFRVHAHIYNVSQRKPTFLIEEDGRGYGANEALGYTIHHLMPGSKHPKNLIARGLRKFGWNAIRQRETRIDVVAAVLAHISEEIQQGYPHQQALCDNAHNTFQAMFNHVSQLNSIRTTQ